MNLPWWKERVFYQIYPRSFQDSNGDGIGDIRGIISRLDYLKWLGIGAIWLCPVYDSPNADMGYDIRNYESIMAEFGTMEDFDQLVEELHKRDIKLVMDLVVNHSSDEHAWFVESRKSKDNPYRDYYIWRAGKNGKEPNNWSSFFTPSAWSYDQETDQWYLHLFSEKQPDLNWENENMRAEVYAMINRWLDKGVDGFRMDVISLIAKAPGLPDGEGEGYTFSEQYFAFQPKLHEYLREMRKACFEGRDCMCVGETTFATTQNAGSVVGDGQELDLLFQFDIMDIDGENGKWNVIPFDLLKLKQIVSSWQKAIDWNTLFWGNHDQPRVVSRFGSIQTEELRVQSAKMLATAMYLMRGTPFIYQGEEIGMTNYPFSSSDELRDVESINLLFEAEKTGKREWAMNGILHKGRDNARTPMQWDASINAGFSKGDPWIPTNPNYKKINIHKSMDDPNSILHYYRELIKFRNNSDVVKFGDFEMMYPSHEKLFMYRRLNNGKGIIVCCNFADEDVVLPKDIDGTVIIQSRYDGEKLGPYGFIVFALQGTNIQNVSC